VVLGVLAVIALLVLGVPSGHVVPSLTSGATTDATVATATAATLLSGPILARTPSSFWGLVAQTQTSRGIATDSAIGGFVNSTPFAWFVYTQQTDQCNITSNTIYADDGSSTSPCGFNIGAFKIWCLSRHPACQSILVLPGENNNSREDANMANYIVHTVGFTPSYFAVGNEPMLWTHYGIAWTHWKTTDASTPTPLAYAVDVRSAIHAVRTVVPSARFIGIASDCECESTWFRDVARVDGSLISAISYHTYPSSAQLTQETLGQFLAPLASGYNITTSYRTVRNDISGQCTGCSTLPIFVTEFNSGPGWAPSNYAGTFTDAVFLAASTVQALRANVSMFTTFNLQTYQSAYGWSMMNGTDHVGPEGVLYSRLFSHLTIGWVRGDGVRTAAGNVWSLLTGAGTSRSLLVVNANASRSIDLSLAGLLKPAAGTSVDVYSWSGTSLPSLKVGSLATSYVLPSDSILLLDFTA
jgi:hypothetical protein